MQFIVNADGTEKRVIGKRESARLKDASRLMVTISRHVEEDLSRQLVVGAVGIEAFLASGSVEDDTSEDAPSDSIAGVTGPDGAVATY